MISFLISLFFVGALTSDPVVTEESCVCKNQETFPVPPSDQKTLFYIQRTPNTNTIMYALNIESDGKLNEDEPVHPYWIRYQEEGQREELSYIQRNYAYGLKTEDMGNGKFELRFVSYKKMPFYLVKSSRDNQYHIHATINKKKIEVSRVFLQIEGGTFWLPNVVCAEVKGVDPDTGSEIVERFKP
ncbi:MAG TPA: DUF4833 domain-containing protein [Ohtaekwangia sp.]|uniref:DUF4833 domain-containing protein n=1 Tax=Ohtaekwangia sp. TaxID=2066019 RepID=UPI002F954B76